MVCLVRGRSGGSGSGGDGTVMGTGIPLPALIGCLSLWFCQYGALGLYKVDEARARCRSPPLAVLRDKDSGSSLNAPFN